MLHTVERGIDCFEVGYQQLRDDFCKSDLIFFDANVDSVDAYSYFDPGQYVLVEGRARFGRMGRFMWIVGTFNKLESAVIRAKHYENVDDYVARHEDGKCVYMHEYEIWHVVDDCDLWQAWEHDAELSRVDAPVLLDERDIDGVELDHEQLWSLNVPGVGPVSFLWYLRRGELVEEYLIADWQSEQPRRLKGVGWYDWMSVEDMLACVQSYEMLRDAAPLDGGGRVGADF